MDNQKNIIKLIGFIVLVTIGIQIYWNYIQYVNHTTQAMSDIQRSLEEAVKTYRSNYSSHETKFKTSKDLFESQAKSDRVESIVVQVLKDLQIGSQSQSDGDGSEAVSYTVMSNEVDLALLDSLLQKELAKKKYSITYDLLISENGKEFCSIKRNLDSRDLLTVSAPIFPVGLLTLAELHYINPFWSSLLKGLTGIILSLILCSAVIFSLYYLLKVIQKQKQLSEIKNDFISNVTHEFKTPIATVSSAMEAIRIFDNEQLSERTRHYLHISDQQLKKLNILVEKVMETSLLESKQLVLHKENSDVIKIIRECTESLKLITEKSIEFDTNTYFFELLVDPFHFENSITNLIDNAIKYGGDLIKVNVQVVNSQCIIKVSDNGKGISKESAPFIFEKFYRESNKQGGFHKGFGIGLYYVKSIVENHGGTIELENASTFTIKFEPVVDFKSENA